MSSETPVKYAVYNLMTYFSRQPDDIRCCPICGSSLSQSRIDPSKAVADDLSYSALIAVHDFSRLYTCHSCHWWAVWESWGFHECRSQADFLIVAEGAESPLYKTSQEAAPWSQILTNKQVYDSAKPLPDTLGLLFVGGERKNSPLRQKNSRSLLMRACRLIPFIYSEDKTSKK